VTQRLEGKAILISGAISDVTDRKELEIELHNKNQILIQSAQARDEMAGVISHEIRNPLHALNITSELMKRMILQKSASVDKILPLIEKLGPIIQSMSKIVSDLLDVTGLEAKALRIEPVKCDLHKIVLAVTDLYEALAKEKQLNLMGQVLPECQFIFCDPDRIRQVLSNLVGNAIKFTGINGSVSILTKNSDNKVEVSVSDTGKGISKDNLEHVFDRFWQAKDSRKLGSGLGLAIAKNLVETHGEKIWVKSELGVGTTFYFTISCADKINVSLPQEN
jgi:signal transduction histidine kinase